MTVGDFLEMVRAGVVLESTGENGDSMPDTPYTLLVKTADGVELGGVRAFELLPIVAGVTEVVQARLFMYVPEGWDLEELKERDEFEAVHRDDHCTATVSLLLPAVKVELRADLVPGRR